MSENMELVNITTDEGEHLIANLTSKTAAFCSFKANTTDEKAKLFEIMNNPEKRLADCINMTIYVKDLYCEVVNCTNTETGEVTQQPRIVVIDKDNIGYQCVSIGIFSAFKKLISIFGEPTWNEPIPLKVKQITKNTRKMLTLDYDFKAGK